MHARLPVREQSDHAQAAQQKQVRTGLRHAWQRPVDVLLLHEAEGVEIERYEASKRLGPRAHRQRKSRLVPLGVDRHHLTFAAVAQPDSSPAGSACDAVREPSREPWSFCLDLGSGRTLFPPMFVLNGDPGSWNPERHRRAPNQGTRLQRAALMDSWNEPKAWLSPPIRSKPS